MNSPAAYTITYTDRPGYVHAFVTGPEDSLEISSRFWADIAAETQRRDVRRLMVEEDFERAITLGEIYQLVEGLLAMNWGPIKVAFVDAHQDQREVNQFGELVAVNRGLHGRVFTEASQAEAWLLAS